MIPWACTLYGKFVWDAESKALQKSVNTAQTAFL